MDFKVGDIVHIKGGTNYLTIEEINTHYGYITVIYFDADGEFHRENIKEGALELVNASK